MSIVKKSTLITLNSSDGVPLQSLPVGYLSSLGFPFQNLKHDDENVLYSTVSLHSINDKLILQC